MKMAPVHQVLQNRGVDQQVVHTGQHYDFDMSDVFFQQLRMPPPDANLQVGSGSHARQTGEIMIRLEPVILEYKPDVVIVYGDVNSTVAAALVSSKLGIKIAHVEAGLRSYDRTMPEEINRLMTDQVSDFLFTPSEDGNHNLTKEGIDPKKVFLVGNVMIDTLVRMLPVSPAHLPSGIPSRFVLVTLHRPSNVDDLEWLRHMLKSLQTLSREIQILFPLHPRTREKIRDLGLDNAGTDGLHLLSPQSYLSFLALQKRAAVVVTDSGGIQEETTFLRVPCLTVRENTERPVTIESGSNVLVGRSIERLMTEVQLVLEGHGKTGVIPPLWDGHAADRIADVLLRS